MKRNLIFAALLLFCSCKQLFLRVMGVKAPRIESYHSVNTYASGIDIDTTKLVFSKDSASCMQLLDYFQGSPELLIFDKSGTYFPYKQEGVQCNAPIENILRSSCSIADNGIIDTTHKVPFNAFLEKLADPNGCFKKYPIENYDYIEFIDFLKYAKKINKDHIISYQQVMKETKFPCKVLLVYVNLDFLDTHGYMFGKKYKMKLGSAN